MAEIKSTLDLVMEKLKDMEISDEERKQFRQKEEKEKAQRLFHRYFKGEGRDWENLRREAKELEATAKEEFLRLIVEEMPLDGPLPDRYSKGLEVVFGQEGKQRIMQALGGFHREKELREGELKEELRREFARKGIRGPAVDPNPRLHPRWGEVMAELQQALRRELLGLLKELPIL